jgi:transposase
MECALSDILVSGVTSKYISIRNIWYNFQRGNEITTQITFTDDEIKQLRYETKNHPHPRVRLKMYCLLLKSEGLPHGKICKIVGICSDTLCAYFKQYIAGGIEELKIVNFHQPVSDLEEYRTIIEEDLDQNPTATLKEAADRIEKLTGIKRSPGRVSVFIKKMILNPEK